MDQVLNVLNFVLQNWETITTILVAVVGFVSARVSKSRGEALEHVAKVIEDLDVTPVKEAVAAQMATMKPAAAGALKDAVNTVDPGKPTPKPWAAYVRAFLSLFGKKQA